MGRPKLAVPFAGRTVLEHVILSLGKGGVKRVGLVTGPHAPELIPLAEAADADVLTIADGTPDIRSIVIPAQAGQRGHPVLIAWGHVLGTSARSPQRGVNMYLRQNSGQIDELVTHGRGVLFNLNGPGDLVALQRQEPLLLDSPSAVRKKLR
jgi:CTP:molybdopterin cytidylyltransferase MocA